MPVIPGENTFGEEPLGPPEPDAPGVGPLFGQTSFGESTFGPGESQPQIAEIIVRTIRHRVIRATASRT